MDPVAGQQVQRNSPGVRHFAITPSDTVDLPVKPRAIRANGAGNVVLTDEGGVDITYTVAAGEILPFSPVLVKATSTTATGLVGWY